MAIEEIQIPFSEQLQERTNWCWAATARCVSHSYNSRSNFTQCTIAKSASGCRVCSQCNQPFHLEGPLRVTSNLAGTQAGYLNWRKIKSEIRAGCIICAKSAWDEDGGHFVSIYGFRSEGRDHDLYIYDTNQGEVFMSHQDFKTNYFNIGEWFFTYFTSKTGTVGA